MSDIAYVAERPDCDVCKHEEGRVTPAEYDARMRIGSWAYLCEDHWQERTAKHLGTGYGQRLVVGEERDRARELREALARGDFDAAEEAIGDGDIADFI